MLCFSLGLLHQEEVKVGFCKPYRQIVVKLCHSLVELKFLGGGALRFDELRHRLIPLYSYDPAEDREWEDDGNENEDEELNVSEPMNLYFLLSHTDG